MLPDALRHSATVSPPSQTGITTSLGRLDDRATGIHEPAVLKDMIKLSQMGEQFYLVSEGLTLRSRYGAAATFAQILPIGNRRINNVQHHSADTRALVNQGRCRRTIASTQTSIGPSKQPISIMSRSSSGPERSITMHASDAWEIVLLMPSLAAWRSIQGRNEDGKRSPEIVMRSVAYFCGLCAICDRFALLLPVIVSKCCQEVSALYEGVSCEIIRCICDGAGRRAQC